MSVEGPVLVAAGVTLVLNVGWSALLVSAHTSRAVPFVGRFSRFCANSRLALLYLDLIFLLPGFLQIVFLAVAIGVSSPQSPAPTRAIAAAECVLAGLWYVGLGRHVLSNRRRA